MDYGLTEREKQMLEYSAFSCKELGDKLFLSDVTIRCHRAHLFEKLNAHSVGDALVIALKNNLIKIEDLKDR